MNENEQVNIAKSVRTLKENMPAIMELAKLNSQLCRAKFVALVEQGFTEAQALELCWRL